MIRATELRPGIAINYEGNVYIITDVNRVFMGRGRSHIQTTMKNIKTGEYTKVRFRSEDSIEQAFVERKPVEYLYSTGSGHVFMFLDTYDQVELGPEIVDEGVFKYLVPNTQVEAIIFDGKIVGIELPITVELKVVETPPVVKGATATNQYKEATLETGLKLRVPPFIEPGEIIKVDTRTGEYIERVKKD